MTDTQQNRLSDVFQRCHEAKRTALIGYLTAGDPEPEQSSTLIHTLASHVDILEIGMPFSDPMADGPVIQAASERALAAGTHIDDVFAIAAKVRESYPALGIVLMGYANTAYAMGFEVFAERAKSAGVDGVLLVDIPPEEGDICDAIFQSHQLHRILLLSPTSSEDRIKLAAKHGSGFVYYVSLTGITGADMGAVDDVKHHVALIRKHTDLPVCVGFGVKTPEQVGDIAKFSEGVVVGSHFVKQIASNLHDSAAMHEALDLASSAMQSATDRR